MTKNEMITEAKIRTKSMTFGQRISNICAGNNNPQKHGYFVRQQGSLVVCTDGKKTFLENGYRGYISWLVKR